MEDMDQRLLMSMIRNEAGKLHIEKFLILFSSITSYPFCFINNYNQITALELLKWIYEMNIYSYRLFYKKLYIKFLI